MTVVVSSDDMGWAESMVSLSVEGRVGKYKRRRMPFAVHKLAMLRDVRMMVDLLHEYHSDRKIDVVNFKALEDAFKLDCFLEDVKDRLVDIFHPVPGGDREQMKKGLGFGEVEPVWESQMKVDLPIPIKLRASEETAPSARGRPRRSPFDVEEQAKKCLRRGEWEKHGIDNLQALVDSLLDNDIKGVVAEDAIREIHASASTLLRSVRHLQRVSIPKTLAEIQKVRNTEVLLER